MNPIGIRQGRLAPPPEPGSRPRFPWQSWQHELERAHVCGFDTVEWLFGDEDHARNPLWVEAGRQEIRRRTAATGVQIASLCGDYFIDHPFFRVSHDARQESIAVLSRLIVLAASVGIRILVVPVLEASEIRHTSEVAQLMAALHGPLGLAAEHGMQLALEIDLPGSEARALICEHRHPALGLCYDAGNATARGYDIAGDVRRLAPFLCEIHVKDRKRHGPSMPLGEGDTDFAALFDAAADVGFRGPFILETPPGDEPLGAAMAHLAFLRERVRVNR
jgi:hexulose-6-phosphate isomerase